MRKYEIKQIPLDNPTLMLNETLFHNANGYIGVRGSFEEGYPEGFNSIRGQYVNGFYDFVDMPQAEKLYGLTEEKQSIVNVVDTQSIKLFIDGEEMSMFTGTITNSSRTLDMDKGLTIREFTWESPKGKRVKISIKRMTSFTILPLFLMDYQVTPLNFEGEIKFCSVHKGDVKNYFDPNDPRVAAEANEHLVDITTELDDGCSFITAKSAKSNLNICSGVKNVIQAGIFDKTLRLEDEALESADNVFGVKKAERRFHSKDYQEAEEIVVFTNQDETIRLLKYTIICDSVRYGENTDTLELDNTVKVVNGLKDLDNGKTLDSLGSLSSVNNIEIIKMATKKLLKEVVAADVDTLYQDQAKYLEEFWDNSDVEITGDDELNAAVRYNLYQLVQSVGKDPHCNIAAKGLSGEGYEGHYFWDTEMYIQPFFTMTSREIAKNLIRYRHTILDYAKENAKILGHKKGAAYPWRTIMGKECSGFFPAGSAQYHISGDIVYAVVKYYLATKDLDIIRECGAETAIEVSRMWMDLGNYYRGEFHLNEVTGPDEYTCLVNNNYYTNVLAKFGLEWTVKLVRLLEDAKMADEVIAKTKVTEAELNEFLEASKKMNLPYDEETGINPQDDSFLQKKMWDLNTITEDEKPLLLHYHPMHLYRYQIVKQADTVLAHFILEDMQDEETIRKSFAYYENVTTHDSSLSTAIYGIVAAKLGLADKAYEYFGESAKLDLFNTHKNTKDGIHTANMGGTYMAIVYGFGGLRVKESGLYLAPILPKQWEDYTFRFLYEDAKIQVKVSKEGCEITLLSGTPKEIYLYNNLETVEVSNVVCKMFERELK